MNVERVVGILIGVALLALVLLQRRRMNKHMREDDRD
jgi:uncharacterized protein (TIGR03382 family)